MADLLYSEVFNRKEGISGRVVGVTPDYLNIEFTTGEISEVQSVSQATFKRWYNIISKPTESDLKTATATGQLLRTAFMTILKRDFETEDITTIYNDKKKTDIIKYNNHSIFEVTATKNNLNVMCHPKSLTPQNLDKAYKTFPKEWNWALRTKFVFTSVEENPLMRSIIADGIYYRKSQL